MTPAWLLDPIPVPDAAFAQSARERQRQLTKPAGSLGRLEGVAIDLAAMQRRLCPRLDRVHIAVFAADHGVAQENVSAFPQAVTAQMVANFARGGAAISVLARELNAGFEVIDLGTLGEVEQGLPNLRRARIAPGTANFAVTAAMTAAQLDAALAEGRASVQRALESAAELFIGGDMGIANSSSAAAIASALLGCAPQAIAGPGTGLDAAGVQHKARVIARALALHAPALDDPLETLRCLGGFEIAALAGAYIAAAQARLPVLVDGFITTAAALAAVRIAPAARPWMLFAHRSAEPGHARLLQALDAQGLLDLGLRLGEGSGAATALPLLRLACALHAGMASFAQAGVAQRDGSSSAVHP